MKKLSNRSFIGAAISIFWLCALAYLAFRDTGAFTKMAPNEWGDFFAGCFAPLAFLWLVLGYMQQGEELQLSTKALQLQAKELSNSVEQQRALVEVTRQQLDSEREARHLEHSKTRSSQTSICHFKRWWQLLWSNF